jgi:hypothetical protein
VDLPGLVVEEDEADEGDGFEVWSAVEHGAEGNAGGRLHGEPERARRDGREGDGRDLVFFRPAQRVFVTRSQQLVGRFVAPVDGAEDVDDVIVRQVVPAGNDRFAGRVSSANPGPAAR